MRWSQDSSAAIKAADPAVPAELHDRASDNWCALIAIADLLGGEWPKRARSAAIALALKDADADEIKTQFLGDIRGLLPRSAAIQSAALIDRLVALEDRPWAEWGRGQKPMSMVQLSRQLSSFEIYPTSFRFGAHVHKGYRLDLFTDAFERYLPPPVPPDIPSVTRLQTEHFPGKSDISSVTPKNTVTDRTVTANPRVTDQNPGENGGEQDSELF